MFIETDVKNQKEISKLSVILNNLSYVWSEKSMVKLFNMNTQHKFNKDKEDFLADLLPFSNTTFFDNHSKNVKTIILSCGWLIYNNKTIDIERDILLPACLAIDRYLEGIELNHFKFNLYQTLVDESYHILIVQKASYETQKNRDLLKLQIPTCSMVKNMKHCIEQHNVQWMKDLILFATAVITEVFICNHLRKLSCAQGIQPLNIKVTRAHLVDETIHSKIFTLILREAYPKMPKLHKEFLLEFLKESVKWFLYKDSEVYENVLKQVGVKWDDNYCNNVNQDGQMDYSTLNTFLEKININVKY